MKLTAIAQISDLVDRQWASLPPAEQTYYENQERSNSGLRETTVPSRTPIKHSPSPSLAVQAVKREPRSPLMKSDVAIDEPPLSAAELNKQKTKVFQLQNLLKDASPHTLE